MLHRVFGTIAILTLGLCGPLAAQTQPPQQPDPPVAAPSAAAPPPPPQASAVPRPPPPPDILYWLAEAGTTTGPFGLQELRQRAQDGALTPETHVWTEGMADWERAAAVAEVAALLPQAPAAAAAPAAPRGPEPDMLHGAWISEGPMEVPGMGMAQTRINVEYRPDGSYAMQGTMTMSQQGMNFSVQVVSSGRWSATPGMTGQLNVTTNGQISMSGPGMVPQTQSVNDTSAVEVIDRNTLRDVASGNLMRRTSG